MVIFDGDRKVFKLDTDNTSYVMGITEEGYLGNIYYGKKVDSTDLVYAMRTGEHPFTCTHCIQVKGCSPVRIAYR